MDNLKKYSYNELKNFFNEYREEWMPTSLLPLNADINPDEKIYTKHQFKKLQDFFSGTYLDNFLCKRINCFDINPNHTHSTPETSEEYQTRVVILLEEWKEINRERGEPTDPRDLEIYQKEMEKLSQIITLWKEEHSFEEQVEALGEYFENRTRSTFSKDSQLYELEERCNKLIKSRKDQENTETPNGSESWTKKVLTSPWTWLVTIIVIGFFIILISKKKLR